MTVSSFAADDLFTLRVTKYHTNNPDRKWSNAYEAQALGSGTESDLLALATAIVEFEQAIHYDLAIFDRVLISTWEPDSVPYNPATFISSPLTGTGSRSPAGGQLEPLNVCEDVRRVAGTGRFGHLFYRLALGEGEVEAPAGKAILTSRSAEQTIVDNALTASGLDGYIAPAATLLKLVLVSADGSNVRDVIQLQVGGVAIVPFNHAWFNRTTSP